MSTRFHPEAEFYCETAAGRVLLEQSPQLEVLMAVQPIALSILRTPRSVRAAAQILGAATEIVRDARTVPIERVDFEAPHNLEEVIGDFLANLRVLLCTTTELPDGQSGEFRRSEPDRIYVAHWIVADAAVAKQLDPDAYQVYLVWLAAIISHEIIHLTRAYMHKHHGVSHFTPPRRRGGDAHSRREVTEDGMRCESGEGGWAWEVAVFGGQVAEGVFVAPRGTFTGCVESLWVIEMGVEPNGDGIRIPIGEIRAIIDGHAGNILPFASEADWSAMTWSSHRRVRSGPKAVIVRSRGCSVRP